MFHLKHKICVRRASFIKKNFICKEKSGTATKIKVVTKIIKHNQPHIGTLVLVSTVWFWAIQCNNLLIPSKHKF